MAASSSCSSGFLLFVLISFRLNKSVFTCGSTSSAFIMGKTYSDNDTSVPGLSFVHPPHNRLICCELKLLAQFAFSLDVNSELVSAEELARSAAAGMAKLCIEKEAGTKSGRTTPLIFCLSYEPNNDKESTADQSVKEQKKSDQLQGTSQLKGELSMEEFQKQQQHNVDESAGWSN
uniref:Uncharacterized protein n=1 Tax=Globodera rostochiensis TaxID=31243 RepID=A0A914GXD7_GLORO